MAALTSKKKITLKSYNDEVFGVAMAMKSQTLRHMIEDDCVESEILNKILAKVIVNCKNRVEVTVVSTRDLWEKITIEDLKTWDEEFIKLDQFTLFDIVLETCRDDENQPLQQSSKNEKLDSSVTDEQRHNTAEVSKDRRSALRTKKQGGGGENVRSHWQPKDQSHSHNDSEFVKHNPPTQRTGEIRNAQYQDAIRGKKVDLTTNADPTEINVNARLEPNRHKSHFDRGQDSGKQREKQHLEYQRAGSYIRTGDVGEDVGSRYKEERGQNYSRRGGGGQFYGGRRRNNAGESYYNSGQ